MKYILILIMLMILIFSVGCWKKRNPDNETINIESIEVPEVKGDEATDENTSEKTGDATENESKVDPGFVLITAPDGLDVHRGPGGPFPTIGSVESGETFRLLDKLDTSNWYKILYTEDETGWIEGSDDTIKIGPPLDDDTVDGDALKRKWAERG